MELLPAGLALVSGVLIGWIWGKLRSFKIEKQWIALQSSSGFELETAKSNLKRMEEESGLQKIHFRELEEKINGLTQSLSTLTIQLNFMNKTLEDKHNEIDQLKESIKSLNVDLNRCKQELSMAEAQKVFLKEKLETCNNQFEELGKKFNLEFENIANKILENKTQKFTELNKNNLKEILDPLGKNIEEFKKSVNEVYDKESKERFSLGEKVKELAQLNKVISEEAKNLTKALKSEVKTQGRWGEMILESILEKSGLRKGEEYFMEHELRDETGNPLKSDSENKKMRPDAVIKYPDQRSVIIDSKVSLNAFTRYLEAQEGEQQKIELNAHVTAIKNRILELSAKGYDDYKNSLDFVMMFIPSEPAYIAAQQGDPNIWNFAYEKRILLINPTNLIISLKLIVDLWKREYQNKNAQKIAERGAKLYDKFVGFIANLEEVGHHLNLAKDSYEKSKSQLSTGNDNLISQVNKLKMLGLKNKKELPKALINSDELTSPED